MRTDKPGSIKDAMAKFQDTLFNRQKYVKNEYQAYGLDLAKELGDWKNRALYIRMAKNMDRSVLEKARYYVKDHTAGTIKTPQKLFMWKIGQINKEAKKGV